MKGDVRRTRNTPQPTALLVPSSLLGREDYCTCTGASGHVRDDGCRSAEVDVYSHVCNFGVGCFFGRKAVRALEAELVILSAVC